MDPTRGYVYFIQQDETQAIKIGYTETEQGLRQRLADLQTGSPYTLRILGRTPGTPALERALHVRFRKYRLSGEWFSPCALIAQALKDIEGEAPQPLEHRIDLAGAKHASPPAPRPRRPAGVVEKKGRWYYRPTSQRERAERAAQGLPETIPLGKAETIEARRKWADVFAG